MSDQEEVKQAVKEALADRRMDELAKQMNQLSTQMELGFASTHSKQDQTNGKVLLHSAEIAAIKSKASYDRLVWYLFTASLGTIIYLLTKHP